MKKQTKVLLAAAMMTMGATFSAMAAETKGTWVLNEEGWQYADKDGEYMDNVWAKSNGIEYWVNDDEVLGSNEWVSEEVEVDGETITRWYYAEEDGSKTVNEWKYLYAFDDEEEENDEHWYYFDAKGRMVASKKKDINGSTYYFNADGQMLTGWVDSATFAATADMTADEEEAVQLKNLVYTNEDGAVVKKSWINVFPWDKEDGYEGEDEKWFYTDGNGKLNINKEVKVDGLSYIFGTNGQMFTKWVGKTYGENPTYVAITDKTEVKDPTSTAFQAVYYCDADNGYVKKDGWREIKEANGGSDVFWYHFDKLGRAFLATDSEADKIGATAQVFKNGEKNTIEAAEEGEIIVNAKKIDGVVYYFNQKGEMLDGLQTIEGLGLVYLEGGARQTGKVTLTDKNENDYTFYFGEKNDTDAGIVKYVAVDGAYKNYLYSDGQLITSDDKDSYRIFSFENDESVIGDYVVDHNGKIQHKDGKDYGFNKKYNFHAEYDYIIGEAE